MSASEQTIQLLTEIRDALRQLVAQQSGGGVGAVASDSDLDGRFGNPEVRMRVRDWSGPDMKGRKFSACPPDFLDLLAESLDWAAGKDAESSDPDKRKYAPMRKKDAARARGWAARIRAGKVAQPAQAESDVADEAWGEDRGVAW